MKSNYLVYQICVAVLFSLISTDVSIAQRSNSKIRQEVAAANQKFMAAFARGDGAGIAALYSESGQLLQPNGEVISGREAIQKYWQGTIDSGIKQMKLETVEVLEMDKMASEVGKYTVFNDKGKILDTGKYIVLWKKGKGGWMLDRDIWNSNLPAQG